MAKKGPAIPVPFYMMRDVVLLVARPGLALAANTQIVWCRPLRLVVICRDGQLRSESIDRVSPVAISVRVASTEA